MAISMHVADIDQAVEAATLAEPLRNGSKRNGNALLAAHMRLGTPGAAELRVASSTTASCTAILPVVQGFVWRARGMSEAAAIAVSGYSTASGLIAAAVRLGRIGAVEAQAVLAALLPTIAALSATGAAGRRDRKLYAVGSTPRPRATPARICACLRVKGSSRCC